MDVSEDPIRDLSELRPGDQVQVWHGGRRQCQRIVEQACPTLGVVWLHEAGDGYRRLINTQDSELRRHAPRAGR